MAELKRTGADALANAARQLQYALEDSATTDLAFEKAYAAAEPQQRAALQQLQTTLQSPESDATTSKSLRLSSFPTLAWLLRQATAPERSAAALFSEFRRQQAFSAASLVVVWGEFAGFLTYLGAVLGILIVVVAMYGLFVLPQFKALYDGLGQELPTLTSALFGRGAPWFALMLVLAAALLVFFSWFVLDLRRRLRRYSPMPPGYQKVPLVGPVAAAYNRYLWLSYAGLLRAARMPADQALRVAGTRVPLPDLGQWNVPGGESLAHAESAASGLTGDLATAARLGKLEQEAQFQQDATVDAFLAELARCRRRTRIVLTILIYYLVATFVSGMYLPIFSIGSAI